MNQYRALQEREFSEAKRFRYAFVVKPGHNFAPLRPYCERLVFLTDGLTDHVDVIREQIEENMQEYDPEKDVLIPVGTSLANMITGTVIHRILLERYKPGHRNYAIGMFQFISQEEGGKYVFYRLATEPDRESYEIIQ